MPSEALPNKEQALFRQVVKLYESKQYKKGIKTAESILKKFPDHGESLCMKGLLLNCMSKKAEAYEFAKKGLKADLRSHVCWHVLGLIYRSDRNYLEASKCYKSALRMDPGNAQIMRDLCLLQLHERDLDGYSETRRLMLGEKSGTKQTWIAYAVAEHVRGHPQLALDVLKKMDSAFINDHTQEPFGRYEESELLLYRALLMLEANRFDDAIVALENEPKIVDQVSKLEYLVYMYYSKNDLVACRQSLAKLLAFNSAHQGYLQTLLAVKNILTEVPPRQIREWMNFSSSESLTPWVPFLNPELSGELLVEKLGSLRSDMNLHKNAFTLLLLELLPSNDPLFESTLTSFVSEKIAKGVPSTFKLLKKVSTNPVVKKVLLHQVSLNNDPIALLVLAQYYDHVGDWSLAIETIDLAIAASPTLVDLFLCKAKILKHQGNLVSSSEVLEVARQLDLADRYLNSKSVKALLRIGEIEKATEVILLFAKDTPTGKANLTDMQCMWWEFELGKAHLAKGNVNEALNVWNDTRKHFEEMSEDEFDFNYYSSRKMTLRSYVEFLKLQDKLRAHKSYRRMAPLFVNTLLAIARKELKPAEKKKKAVEPETTNWFKHEDILGEALSVVKDLQRKAPEWPTTRRLAFEVYLERKEYSLCVPEGPEEESRLEACRGAKQ